MYQFNLIAIQKGPAAIAARRAVMTPICRRKIHLPELMLDAGAKLVKKFRSRCHLLREDGWDKLRDKKRYYSALCCPPAIVIAAGQAGRKPCRLTRICPWCCAREVMAVYKKIYATVAPKIANYRLYTVEVMRKHPATTSSILLSADLYSLASSFKRLATKINSFGSFYRCSIDCNADSFTIHGGFLGVMPNGWEPAAPRPSAKLYDGYMPKQIISALSRVMRYPRGLLFAPITTTRTALAAMDRMHLRNFTGCLRGSKLSDDSNENELGPSSQGNEASG